MLSWLTICTLNISVLLTIINANAPCRFETEKGIIDLTYLANSNGTAAYPDKTPTISTNFQYSYNPCKPFSEGNTCIDAAVCQFSVDGQYTFILGKHDSARWNLDTSLTDIPTISYQYNDKIVNVSLHCGDDVQGHLEVLGESPMNTYQFRLTSKCACWDGCFDPPPDASTKLGGGGSGILFIIIFLFYFNN